MTEVEISIVGTKATAKKKGALTCGMVGVPVSFIFDQSWEGLNIIPVFRCGGIIKDNGIKNNRTTIPYEVLQYAGNELYIGAEGRSTDGKLAIPTVWARIGRVHQGARATGDMGLEPTPTQFDRFMAEIEKTDDKVTKAVEEIIATGALKGEQGNPGASGKDGVDGVSATHCWNGTVLTVTSASGTSSADLKGDKGDTGANGNDYVLTDADKAEIAQQAAALVPNDSNPADWVATKKAEGGENVYIPEQTLSSGLWDNLQMSLQPDFTYDVTFNGEVYTCVARANGAGAILGNNHSLTLNDYPFCISWAGGSATGGMFFKSRNISYPVTLKVTDHAEYVYDKMPEGYLPDCVVKSVNGKEPDWHGNVEIEVPSGSGVDVTASVGQTIVVEEVDANGKPTKWKAADYQPRTHWTEETVILPETTVEIDPETGIGLIPVDFTVEGGKKYTINYNGVDYADCECLELEGQILFGNLGAIDENMLVTEHPFVIAYTAVGEDNEGNSIFAWACVTLDGSTSVNLSITDVQHTPIPVEYVTNAFPCYIDATGSGTDDDPAIFNCNVNVLEAYKKGREIKLRRTLYDPLTVVYYNLVGASLVDNVERLEIWLFEFVYATPGSAHNAFLYVYVDRNGNIEKASD